MQTKFTYKNPDSAVEQQQQLGGAVWRFIVEAVGEHVYSCTHVHLLKDRRGGDMALVPGCDIYTGTQPQSSPVPSTWPMQQLQSALKGKIGFPKVFFHITPKNLWSTPGMDLC